MPPSTFYLLRAALRLLWAVSCAKYGIQGGWRFRGRLRSRRRGHVPSVPPPPPTLLLGAPPDHTMLQRSRPADVEAPPMTTSEYPLEGAEWPPLPGWGTCWSTHSPAEGEGEMEGRRWQLCVTLLPVGRRNRRDLSCCRDQALCILYEQYMPTVAW